MASSIFSKTRNFFSKHPLLAGLLSMFVAGCVLVWLILCFLDVWTHHGDDATVPEIKHLTYGEAKQRLAESELEIEISDSIYDTSLPPGTIVESWPKAGSQVKRGRKVYITLTAFSPKNVTISMPITGVSARQAVSYLNALGINGVRIVNVPSQYPDLVEGAHYDGRPIGVGSILPVDAKVVLEVGMYTAPAENSDSTFVDESDEHYASEQAVIDDLSSARSVYIDDEP